MLKEYRIIISSTGVIVLFVGVYIVSQVIIAIILYPLDYRLFLKAQTTFSRDLFLELLRGWEKAGLIGRYQLHFYFDFVHPLWYSVALSALIAKAMDLNRISDRFNILLLVPFVAGFLDLVENCFHVFFISDYSTITDQNIFLSALASNTKWVLAFGMLVISLLLFGKHLLRKEGRK